MYAPKPSRVLAVHPHGASPGAERRAKDAGALKRVWKAREYRKCRVNKVDGYSSIRATDEVTKISLMQVERFFLFLVFCGLLVLAALNTGGRAMAREEEAAAAPQWTCDQEADEAIAKGDFGAGILAHERLVEKDPANALAWYHLGYCYGAAADHFREVYCYEKAAALGLRASHFFFNLGMAYGEISKIQKSLEAFSKSIAVDPFDADSYFGMALSYYKRGEDDHAEQALMHAVALEPNHHDARMFLAILCLEQNRREEAEYHLRKIMDPALEP